MKVSLVLILFVAGCNTFGTPEALRWAGDHKQWAGRYEFTMNDDYKSVYTKILNNGRKERFSTFNASGTVDGELDDDNRKGTVSSVTLWTFGSLYNGIADVSGTGDRKTRVVYYWPIGLMQAGDSDYPGRLFRRAIDPNFPAPIQESTEAELRNQTFLREHGL